MAAHDRMQANDGNFSAEYLRSRLDYCPTTGKLRWRHQLGADKRTEYWNSRWAGTIAGKVCPDGYRKIKIAGGAYSAHRLAWLHVTGNWPGSMMVDHRDGNKSNDAFSNLRLATPSQNSRNRKTPRTNSSGLKGVCWESGMRKWKAQIRTDSGLIRLGYFDSKDDAGMAYATAAAQHHGEFARVS